MLYTIIESFSSQDAEAWSFYCNWRKLRFERFDSIDGLLRPSLIDPIRDEDWPYLIDAHYINDYTYARRRRDDIGSGLIVGVRFETHDQRDNAFLGYDIIDGYNSVSLLTNWGNKMETVNQALASNALIPDWDTVRKIQEELHEHWGDDGHVKGCRIVSIYKCEL